jgi:hypothetical protein
VIGDNSLSEPTIIIGDGQYLVATSLFLDSAAQIELSGYLAQGDFEATNGSSIELYGRITIPAGKTGRLLAFQGTIESVFDFQEPSVFMLSGPGQFRRNLTPLVVSGSNGIAVDENAYWAVPSLSVVGGGCASKSLNSFYPFRLFYSPWG